jgi:hypothetical protein
VYCHKSSNWARLNRWYEGPKALGSFATVDNGFARFDRVRIPKENMLSKFAQVTDAGQYVQPPHSKLNYGGVSLCTLLIYGNDCTDITAYRCCISARCRSKVMVNSYFLVHNSVPLHRMVTDAARDLAKG